MFLGDLSVGASSAGRALGIPSQLGAVVQGTLLLTTIALLAVRRNRAAGAISPEAAGEVADSVAADVVVGDAIQDDEEARA